MRNSSFWVANTLEDEALPQQEGIPKIETQPSKESIMDTDKHLLDSKGKASIKLRDSITLSTNRILLLVASLIYVMLTGPGYFNWAPLRSNLYKSGAYVWYCDPSELSVESPTFQEDGIGVCTYQAIAVNRMVTVATYVHFSFAILAGLIVDWIGPKKTAIVGVFFQIIGWSMLAVASKSLQLYLPSVIFIGIGIETSFLPILSVADLFPKFSSSIISLIGGARSLSFAVPLLLQVGMMSFSLPPDRAFTTSVCIFVGAGLGTTLLIAITLIPLKPWGNFIPPQTEVEHSKMLVQRTRASFASSVGMDDVVDVVSAIHSSAQRRASARRRHSRVSEMAENKLYDGEPSPSFALLMQGDSEEISASRRPSRSLESQAGMTDMFRLPSSAAATSRNANLSVPGSTQRLSIRDEFEEDLDPNLTEEEQTVARKHLSRWADFKNQLLTFEFIAIVIFCMISVSRSVYFSVASESLLPNSLEFFGIISVFSFAPAPIFGYLCDYIGILPVMQICNMLAVGMFITTAIPSIPASVTMQYVAGIIYSFVVSFLLSQVYCYGVTYFSKQNMGKLLGIVIGLGGISCLLVDPIFSLAKQQDNFLPASLAFIVASVVNGFLLLFIQFKKQKLKAVALADEESPINDEAASP